MTEVTIDPRFCGPPDSANGGYTCGLLARFVDGPAEVTLRSPPPLGRSLRVDDGALLDGDTVVAQAKPAAGGFDVPAPVSVDEALAATEHYEWMHDHPYPTCFVCGPERAEGDGLRIFASLVDGRELYAAPWTPTPDLAGPEFTWAALDCPSGLVTNLFEGIGRTLLGRLTAELHAPVRPGEEHVLTAWPIARDGRKYHSGSALFSAEGELLAAANAVWIEVDGNRGGAGAPPPAD
jgi:hypothetical protein